MSDTEGTVMVCAGCGSVVDEGQAERFVAAVPVQDWDGSTVIEGVPHVFHRGRCEPSPASGWRRVS